VRHIDKRLEPKTVTDTRCVITTDLSRAHSARDAFEQLDKNAVRKQLVAEQGWLCAFCMQRIDEQTLDDRGEHVMKVAHRMPIAVDPNEALNWYNLLGSCDGGQRRGHIPRTCDLAQRSTALTVDPTKRESILRLYYERRDKEGLFITSADSGLRSDVHCTLALNEGELPALREAAWKAFLDAGVPLAFGTDYPVGERDLAGHEVTPVAALRNVPVVA